MHLSGHVHPMHDMRRLIIVFNFFTSRHALTHLLLCFSLGLLTRRSSEALDLLPRLRPPPLRLACDPADVLPPVVEHVIQRLQL
jgi:hypothetical protein